MLIYKYANKNEESRSKDKQKKRWKKNMDYQISKEESDRIQFLRLIFSVMVVFIHSYTEKVNFAGVVMEVQESAGMEWFKFTVSNILSRCAVPGFFLISAVLLYKKDFSWKKNIKRKIQSLFVPYFILNTFWIAVLYGIQKIPVSRLFFHGSKNIISQWGLMEWADAYLGITRDPMLYPLWFIRDLMILNVIAKILKIAIDRFPKICFILIVAALLFNIDSGIFCLKTDAAAFFCMGYYIVKYNLRFMILDKVPIALIGFLYVGLICVEYLTNGIPALFIIYALSKALGILFWARVSKYFMGSRYKNRLLWVAKYNFSIYLFHELSLTMLKKALFKIFAANVFLQESVYFILPVVIIPFCIFLSRIMEKVMPGVYRVLTGDRKQYSE